MARPVHFEIHADEPDRAIDFYETALGWTFRRFGDRDYWLIDTGSAERPGINGALLKRKGTAPSPDAAFPLIGYVCTMEVYDLDTFMHAIENAGGAIIAKKQLIPGVGWLTYAKDTEGNIFGLSQPDPNAA
jgi:predicted enzyme related to lactoylglutathione lyase